MRNNAAIASDTESPTAQKRLSIDWSATKLDSDADALALWQRIAPTGDDWSLKLDEVPEEVSEKLAVALLRAGNFTCMTPPAVRDCMQPQFDVDTPKPTATLADPCLRRLLAQWSLEQVDRDDARSLLPALKAIAAIPPPETQLVSAVLELVPEADQPMLLELIAIANAAGHAELAGSMVGRLEEPLLIHAVQKHHIAAALDVLSAEGHRAVYRAAIVDDALPGATRAKAIDELVSADDKLAPDVKGTLVKAAAAKDCVVAARAARALDRRGDKRFVPKRPHANSQAAMMRSLCVLASYEPLQENSESSLLATFVPPKGLERVDVAYDPYNDLDADGDGNPHTIRSVDLVARDALALPEVADMARAMKQCKGTICASNEHVFTFGLKLVGGQLMLARLEVADRPPCNKPVH